VRDAAAERGQAFYLGEGEDGVLAVHHAPAGDSRSPVAVLLLAPFGNAELCAHRSLREWAGALAADGHHALRFDLPGGGDSAGDAHSSDLAGRWVHAAATAAAWLRGREGVVRVTALGVGLGGVVAARAAAEHAEVDDLVLWSVHARVRMNVRELRAFARLEASVGSDASDGGGPTLVAGGFAMSAETVATLEALDLSALDYPVPASGRRRALLLGRDGIAPDDRLRERLLACDWDVEIAPGDGLGWMLAEPYEARPPRATFAVVEAWLQRAPSGTHAATAAGAAPRPADTLELDVHGTGVRERIIAIDHGGDVLPGVLAEPHAAHAGTACVVFLNAGALRRVGPNRMWVESARRLAARGVPTFRVDLAGIGDADGDDEGWSDDASFYAPEFVGQALAVLDGLAARGLGPDFVLAGLCSGAYWSFHAALADERVRAALMLNTRALFWDGQRRLTQEASHSRKLVEPRLWLKVLRGGIARERMLAYARAIATILARAPARLIARVRARATGGDRLDHALDALEAHDQRLWVMFGPQEQMRLELEGAGRIESVRNRPGVHVDLIDGDLEVHTLEPLWLQREVHALLDRAVERELAHMRRGD
jgi:alpha/beta superfamily hydrolase